MKRNTYLQKMQKLSRLEAEIATHVARLAQNEPILIGSISQVLRTCGKPNCRCAQSPCHPHVVLMSVTVGKRRCQLVRKADVDETTEKVQRYRECRSALKKIKALHKKWYNLLHAILEARNEPYS